MVAPAVGVLALQGGVREHVDMLASLGAAVTAVRTPKDLANIGGVVIPGGESSTIDRLLRIFGLFDPLRLTLAQGLPVLGTCAGRSRSPARSRTQRRARAASVLLT